jgi:hypothetical protein
VNQYAVTWGATPLRDAIAADVSARHGLAVDADRQVTVCCGSTEAMMATMMAVVDPGDEVIVFEPFYENYGPDAVLSGAVPRFVSLREPRLERSIPDELAAAFSRQDPRDHHQHAQQPDGEGLHARGTRADRRPVRAVGRDLPSPTRSTSTSSTTGPCTCRWRRCRAWRTAR